MIVKVGNSYLELNDLIEVEKKVKLLEDISTVDGDFSYSFFIPKTNHNEELIRFFSISNISTPWNFRIPAEIQDDSGISMYSGYIRGESYSEQDRGYTASFYSGNSTWIEELSFHLSEVDWEPYDRSQFPDNIIESWSRDSGIIWPLVDRGALGTRSSATVYEDDFQPFIYYKNIVEATLNKASIKIKGDLLKDPIYNSLITTNNGRKGFQKRIEQRSVRVGKNVPQTINSTTYANVTFPNVSNPNYNSDLNNWSTTLYRYTFDVDVKQALFNIYLKLSTAALVFLGVRILYNGSVVLWDKNFNNVKIITTGNIGPEELEVNIGGYSVGDYIELQARVSPGFFFTPFDIDVGSYFEVKPIKFFTAFADALVPDLTGTELLGEVFTICNIIPSYNQITREIDTRKFSNIANEDPIDVSEYVTISDDNYEEFVSDYSKRNLFLWEDQSSDDVENYNDTNIIPYGGGYIDINNDFLKAEGTLVEMAFVAAFQKAYPSLGMELPILNYVSVSETTTVLAITSVTDNGGFAQFNHAAGTIGSLVRITNSTNELYNGDYRKTTISGTAFVLQDLPYDTNATATATELEFVEHDNDEQVLLLNNVNLSLPNYTGIDSIYFSGNGSLIGGQTSISIANFLPFNRLRGSLSFGSISEPSSLISKYYRIIVDMLNTGVKCIGTALLPMTVYRDIDFLRPLFFSDGKRSSLFYPNKLTGYISSKISAVIELIKLK